MKLILRADVENLGSLGDVVDVKPGYGRNYLLPQGLAMIATEANLKTFELERKKLQARMDALRAASVEELSAVEGVGEEIGRSLRDWFTVDWHLEVLQAWAALLPPPSLAMPLPLLVLTLTAAASSWMRLSVLLVSILCASASMPASSPTSPSRSFLTIRPLRKAKLSWKPRLLPRLSLPKKRLSPKLRLLNKSQAHA